MLPWNPSGNSGSLSTSRLDSSCGTCSERCTFLHHHPVSADWLYQVRARRTFGLVTKPDIKKYVPYDFTYMKFKSKQNLSISIEIWALMTYGRCWVSGQESAEMLVMCYIEICALITQWIAAYAFVTAHWAMNLRSLCYTSIKWSRNSKKLTSKIKSLWRYKISLSDRYTLHITMKAFSNS